MEWRGRTPPTRTRPSPKAPMPKRTEPGQPYLASSRSAGIMDAISRPCSAIAPALNRAAKAGTAGTAGRRPAGPKSPQSNSRCSSAPPRGYAAPNSLVPRLHPAAPRACQGYRRLRYPQAPESLPRATPPRRGADSHGPHPLRREVPDSGPAPPPRHWPPARPASSRGRQVAVLREEAAAAGE